MPQFDFSTYPSQIFWFTLCFLSLYLTAHFVILPRIQKILLERENAIESNLEIAKELNNKIEKLNKNSDSLLQNANRNYQTRIEEIIKISAKNRELSIQELKTKIDHSNKKSRDEIKILVENSIKNNTSLIEELKQKIQTKILN